MVDEAKAREEICEIGRRIYARGFASGNDGNISCRLADGRLLCTPTMISKGFMSPEDLCLVDLDGNQISGARARTSEVLLHTEIYRGDSQAQAVVHCHPPHATAFGVARVDIPTGILPEVEVFLGQVPRADYATPGSTGLPESVRPFVGKANTIVLSNHGTVSWGPTVEQAFWYTEILDGYCRVLLLAKQIGHVERLPQAKLAELRNLRQNFGLGADPGQSDEAGFYVNPEFGNSSR